ncbi:MAG: hypothetical protein H6839_16145 [Planctomycetes bacterium]|nr:hypothetical protein [Planctomycetota bacterium]
MLDVVLGKSTLGFSRSDKPRASFEDEDPRYWFLYPFFESIYDRTQQMVDLYGHAAFKGRSREVLREMLEQARAIALSQPERWFICTGRRSNGPSPGPVFQHIVRKDLLEFIGQLLSIVALAIESGSDVLFEGD